MWKSLLGVEQSSYLDFFFWEYIKSKFSVLTIPWGPTSRAKKYLWRPWANTHDIQGRKWKGKRLEEEWWMEEKEKRKAWNLDKSRDEISTMA